MKKISLMLIALLLVFVSCDNTPQGKAEKVIKKHLKETIEQYEPVSFTKLDTLDVANDARYNEAKDSLDFHISKLTEMNDQFTLAAHQKAAKEYKQLREDLEAFYKDKKYRIDHVFQSKEGERMRIFYLNNLFEIVE
jgi:hypothetical protein